MISGSVPSLYLSHIFLASSHDMPHRHRLSPLGRLDPNPALFVLRCLQAICNPEMPNTPENTPNTPSYPSFLYFHLGSSQALKSNVPKAQTIRST